MNKSNPWKAIAATVTRLRTPLLIGIVVVAAVPVAQGSPSGVVQRIAAVEKKLRSLQSTVGGVQGDMRSAKTDLEAVKTDLASAKTDLANLKQCVQYKVVGVAQYGHPEAGEGYIYTKNYGADLFGTTAMDFADRSNAQAFLAVVNPSCITSSSALKLAPHHAAGYRLTH
jgi:outer membrane murein-binding lipoprotein Lpp